MRRSGWGKPDTLQPLQCPRTRRCALQRSVALNDFDDLVADTQYRIQARRRLLKDDADAATAHIAHACLGQHRDLGTGQIDPSRVHSAVVGQ